jgi:hypothetical protein
MRRGGIAAAVREQIREELGTNDLIQFDPELSPPVNQNRLKANFHPFETPSPDSNQTMKSNHPRVKSHQCFSETSEVVLLPLFRFSIAPS